MNTPGAQPVTGVQRRRVARPGLPGASAATWAARLAGAAFVLATAWLLVALLRPLPEPDPPARAEVPAPVDVTFPALGIEAREHLLSGVRGVNYFALDRRPWPVELASDGPAEPVEQPPPTRRRTVDPGVSGPLASIDIAEPDSLPDDVKKALKSIALRGVRRTLDGRAIAMISFIHSGNQFRAEEYAVGDEFTDEKNPGATWRVELIDDQRDAVVLSRSDTNVLLSMYDLSGAQHAGNTDSAALPADEAQAAGLSRSEVVAELLEADVSTEDIRALLDLLDQPRTPATPEVSALDQVAATNERAPTDQDAGRAAPAPSEGMRQLLLMMMQGKPPSDAQPGRRTSRDPDDDR